jgi:hypothetical protein
LGGLSTRPGARIDGEALRSEPAADGGEIHATRADPDRIRG